MSLNKYIDLSVKPLIEQEIVDHIDNWTYYPVLNHANELIGTITEESLFSYQIENLSIEPSLIISNKNHPLECLAKFKVADSNILFIVDNGLYLGALTYSSLIDYFTENTNLESEFSIIELSIESHQYSMADIARIVESEGAQILNFTCQSDYNYDKKYLVLTINQHDLKRILGILENKGYHIENLYNEYGFNSQLKERYDHLMHYLNQ
jgi:acetoin utilization protein AcuB